MYMLFIIGGVLVVTLIISICTNLWGGVFGSFAIISVIAAFVFVVVDAHNYSEKTEDMLSVKTHKISTAEDYALVVNVNGDKVFFLIHSTEQSEPQKLDFNKIYLAGEDLMVVRKSYKDRFSNWNWGLATDKTEYFLYLPGRFICIP